MSPTKRAAIDPDVLNKPLAELSAVQFLTVLQDARVSPAVMALLPDKKKYELWVDEGNIGKINLGDLLERIRREKKKLELEKRVVIEHIPKKLTEYEFDPDHLFDPVVRERLVSEIVEEVVKRVGR